MTQKNKEHQLSILLLAAADRVARLENNRTASGRLKPYTSYRLSKATGSDSGYLYRVLHGTSHPSRSNLIKICIALQCSRQEMDDILTAAQYSVASDDELEEVSHHVAA